MPISNPCFFIACTAYSEQLTENLQLGGKKGATKYWYIPIVFIAATDNHLIKQPTSMF